MRPQLRFRNAALLVQTPRSLRVMSRVLVGVLAMVAIGAMIVPWQQTVSGQGRVVAFSPNDRQQEVDAPIEGRITQWHVREGSLVQVGDLLVELTDNDPLILERLNQEKEALSARREATLSRVESLVARQKSLEASRKAGIRAAEQRVVMANERSRAAKQTVAAADASHDTAQRNLERQSKLAEQGLSSQRNLELAQLETVRTSTEAERARATLQAALGESSALDADRFRGEYDLTAAIADAKAAEASALAEEANAAAELSRVDVRLARQSSMEIRAPMAGTVLRVRAGQGNGFTKAGEPLLTLVPHTAERAVELWIDGNDMPLVASGRTARLQFEGWPAVQFSGWPSVAVGTFGGKVALIDATDDGAGRFRIVIRPESEEAWPSDKYLRQGVRVNGWVLLDQVKIGYELWRRFNGFPPTVALKEVGAKETKGESK